MKDIVIIGAGDTGREMVNLIERINTADEAWQLIGFVDDKYEADGDTVEGYPLLGKVEWLNDVDRVLYAVCTIGDGQIKKKVISRIVNSNVRFAALIDPMAQLHKGTTYGEGCLIYSNAITSINVKIGNHVYVSLMSTIGHDTVIGDFCSIYPGCNISGKVIVGESVEFGTGSKVIQGVHIGDNAVIGAGAVVINDIPANCVAVGCPAKPVKWL